ncbi:MAG: hypothetical protein ABDK94_04450 [Atribacterota bacterium]
MKRFPPPGEAYLQVGGFLRVALESSVAEESKTLEDIYAPFFQTE